MKSTVRWAWRYDTGESRKGIVVDAFTRLGPASWRIESENLSRGGLVPSEFRLPRSTLVPVHRGDP